MAIRGAVSFCSALVRWFGSSLKPLGAVAKLGNSHAPGEEFLGWTNFGMFPSPNSAVLPWKDQKTISAQRGKRKSALQATAAIATFQVFPVSWHLRKTRDDSPPDASGGPKKNRHRPWHNLGTPIRSYQCLPVSPIIQCDIHMQMPGPQTLSTCTFSSTTWWRLCRALRKMCSIKPRRCVPEFRQKSIQFWVWKDPNIWTVLVILAKEGVAKKTRTFIQFKGAPKRSAFAKALMHFRTKQQKLPPKWEPNCSSTEPFELKSENGLIIVLYNYKKWF
jgi:hypothetical protein